MSKFYLVKATIDGEQKKSDLVQETLDDGSVVFHKFKRKTHRWPAKYGAYGVLVQKAGSCESYNIGKYRFCVDSGSVEMVREIAERIAVGFDF